LSPKLSDQLKEKRNLQILEAAKRVFVKKGYSAASLKDIIDETGMSRGWIYLYYQSKEEIFEALLDHQDREYEQYIAHLINNQSTIWEVIYELYTQQLTELQSAQNGGLMSAFYEYFLTGWRDEARRQLLVQRYERGIAQFANIVQVGVERGEFSPTKSITEISKLAASYQEGIVTHSIAVGTEEANTSMQFEALTSYLKQLLNPSVEGNGRGN